MLIVVVMKRRVKVISVYGRFSTFSSFQVHDRFSNSFVYLGGGGLEKLRRVGEAHVRGEGAKVQRGGGAEVEAEGGSATYCGCFYISSLTPLTLLSLLVTQLVYPLTHIITKTKCPS